MKNLNFPIVCCLLLTFFLLSCSESGSSEGNEDESIISKNELEDGGSITEDAITYHQSILYVASLSGMNLRSEPSTSGEVVERIAYGQTVELIRTTGITFESSGFSGEWIEVKYQDKQGYLFDGFLLPIEAPGFNPPATLIVYFEEQLQPIGIVIAQKNINDTGNDHRDWKVISEDEIEITDEADFFRTYREYAGGYILYEEYGFEYHANKGFFPNLTIEHGFLLIRAMYPQFFVADDCFLELGSMSFPKESGEVKGVSNCTFTVEVEKNRSGQKVISISNSDLGYAGLEVKEVKGGIEIKNFFAM